MKVTNELSLFLFSGSVVFYGRAWMPPRQIHRIRPSTVTDHSRWKTAVPLAAAAVDSNAADDRRRDLQARLALEEERLVRLQKEAELIQQSTNTANTANTNVASVTSNTSNSSDGVGSDASLSRRKNRPMTSVEKKRLEALLAKEDASSTSSISSRAPSANTNTDTSTTTTTTTTITAVPRDAATVVPSTTTTNINTTTNTNINPFAEDTTRPMTTIERKRLEAQRFRDQMMGTTSTSSSSPNTATTTTDAVKTIPSNTEEIYAQAYKKAYEDAYQKSLQEFQSKMQLQEPTVINDIQKIQQEAAAARQAEAERLRKTLYETRAPPKPVFPTTYPRSAPIKTITTGQEVKVQLKDSTGSVTQQIKFPTDVFVAAAIPSTVAGAIYLRSSLENRPQVKKEKEMDRASVQIQTSADKIESAAEKIEKSADKMDLVQKRWNSSASTYLDGLQK